jgi:hypothetical protein
MLLGTFGLLGTKPPLDVDLAEAATFSLGRTADDLRAAFDELETRAWRNGAAVSLAFSRAPLRSPWLNGSGDGGTPASGITC